MTAGERNKNPLNIKGTGWQGQVGSDDRGHAIFENTGWGTRAAMRNLRTYWTKYKLRTVAEILSRWAPSTDTIGSIPGAPPNSPEDYTKFVCSEMGVEPNETLTILSDDGNEITNSGQFFELLHAMAIYENGHHYDLSTSTYDAGESLF